MEEYSYFIADIFGNLAMVSKKEFDSFFDVFESTYPDYFCNTHIDSVISHYQHKHYYHDGKIYCSILRDLNLGGAFCE